MTRLGEFEEKRRRVTAFLNEKKLDAVLLSLQSNVSWLTCGTESHISIASTESSASVLITPQKCYVIANNIEAPRFEVEEIGELGIKIQSFAWHTPGEQISLVKKLAVGKISSDDGKVGENIGEDFSSLRYSLTETEVSRYRELGKNARIILEEIARAIKPGQKECSVAGNLAKSLLDVNITPIAFFVAADERIEEYRHPLPTEKKGEKMHDGCPLREKERTYSFAHTAGSLWKVARSSSNETPCCG